ncbi:hypothetical protein [Polaromonas sp. LjRoot131]|uniref:hypothetical protein n=1 Tax=Polaromonas sp. LjRoot131 TaxID=3342262 RepID=UPI003ED07271
MPLPFLISCKLPAVRLYELGDGRFQLIEQGPIAPLMSGYRYLIVERALALFLDQLGLERARQEPAVLFNRATGEEMRTHVRLHISQFLTQNMLADLPLEGLRLLTFNDEYYFASPELKACLEASPFGYLQFSEGFSGFAGNAV